MTEMPDAADALSPPPGTTPSEMFPVLTAAQQARVLAHGQRRNVAQGGNHFPFLITPSLMLQSRFNRAHPASTVIIKCLMDFRFGVHHERSIARDWLIQRQASD